MKLVVGVSLGASERDYRVDWHVLGETVRIERFGTDGDVLAAKQLVRSFDGRVDAIGLGGINLHYYAGHRRYVIPQGMAIKQQAGRTPVVDGSGIKDTAERDMVEHLVREAGIEINGRTALVVSVLDRFGLAEALANAGCRLIIGDALFGLGIPLPFYSMATFQRAAGLTLPVLRHVPINRLYPLGKNQEEIIPRFQQYYQLADILAGDFHFIRRHLPASLPGKTVITSTVTNHDVALLRSLGVKWLAAAAPDLNGRSCGANVLEAVLVALAGLPPEEHRRQHYRRLLRAIAHRPRVERLN